MQKIVDVFLTIKKVMIHGCISDDYFTEMRFWHVSTALFLFLFFSIIRITQAQQR